MVNQAFPTLDGVEVSWADIQTTYSIYGGSFLRMSDFAAIKWSRKVDVGVSRGANGGRVMKRTLGQGDQEASATFYRSGLRNLIKGLKAVAPTRGRQRIIGAVGFDIFIQHTPIGDSEIYQVKLKGCRYLGDSDDMKEGADPDQVEVTLNPIEIVQIIDGEEIVLL